MRIILITLSFFLLFSTSHAQKYRNVNYLISGGVRVATFGNETADYSFVPVNLSVEKILIDKWVNHKMALGGGIEAGYFEYTRASRNYRVETVSLLVSFHYTFNRQFETFAGVLPGYSFDTYENTSIDASGFDGFNNSFMFGARYYFIPELGVYTRALISDFGIECGLTFMF